LSPKRVPFFFHVKLRPTISQRPYRIFIATPFWAMSRSLLRPFFVFFLLCPGHGEVVVLSASSRSSCKTVHQYLFAYITLLGFIFLSNRIFCVFAWSAQSPCCHVSYFFFTPPPLVLICRIQCAFLFRPALSPPFLCPQSRFLLLLTIVSTWIYFLFSSVLS